MTLTTTDENKNQFRKIRRPDHPKVRVAHQVLQDGCHKQGAYIQFLRDVVLYGLWSALLSAKNYEGDGCYEEGTVDLALTCAVSDTDRE
jgi:hypothetical protein